VSLLAVTGDLADPDLVPEPQAFQPLLATPVPRCCACPRVTRLRQRRCSIVAAAELRGNEHVVEHITAGPREMKSGTTSSVFVLATVCAGLRRAAGGRGVA
jgi:hypothetical protein